MININIKYELNFWNLKVEHGKNVYNTCNREII